MRAWPFGIPYWLWVLIILALVIFVGQALHLFTIKFSLSIP